MKPLAVMLDQSRLDALDVGQRDVELAQALDDLGGVAPVSSSSAVR